MNQFKIGCIVLLLGLFTSGCYTVVHYNVAGDVNEYYPPQPPPPPPPYYPPQPIIIIPTPVNPPPQDYKTRPPENNDGKRKRDDGVVGQIRDKGGRGNDGSRR